MFRKLALIVLFVCLLAAPVLAQDATPEATAAPPVTIINEAPATAPVAPLFDLSAAAPYLVVILLLGGLLVFETVDRRKLATLAANSLTPTMYAMVRSGADTGMGRLQQIVDATPTPIDDAILQPFRADYDDLATRIQALEDAKSAPAVVNNINPTPAAVNAAVPPSAAD